VVAPAILHRILFGQTASHKPKANVNETRTIPESIREARQMLSESVDKIGNVIEDHHLLGAVRLRLEQQMYFPRYYLRSEPFIRLEMNKAYYTDTSHEEEPLHISLMIHRSGICIMTFATPIARQFGLDEGYRYLQARMRILDQLHVSLPIIGRHDLLPRSLRFRSRTDEEIRDGHKWTILNNNVDDAESPKLSILIAFYIYLRAVQKIAGRKISTEWRCNTTLFQGTPRCGCTGAEAKERHASQFAQLLVRARSRMPLTDEAREDLLRNYLMNSDQELWLTPGCAIHTFWERENIDYISDIETVIPIESAILQYRQLEAIDHRTIHVSIRDRDLFAAQKQLATGLPEYGRNLMTDINAPLVVEGLASRLRTSELYDRLNDRVKVLESVVNTRYTRKQSRRSLAIPFIGLIIAVLLLPPRIKELMDSLAKLTRRIR
jgi:hypothetical protein